MADPNKDNNQQPALDDRRMSFEEKERLKHVDELLREQEAAFMEEEKTVIRWKSPGWAFKQRSREYFTTIGAMVILVTIILLFVREFLFVAVVWAGAFLVYSFASVKPDLVEHEITTRGLKTGEKFYRWDILGRFWFGEKHEARMLMVETGLSFPSRLIMLLAPPATEEKVKDVLRRYLLNETPAPSFVDKASDWLVKKVPLEEG
jgi:hypothetical protein